MKKDGILEVIRNFWDQHHKLEVSTGYWTCHPIINEYVNSLIAHDSSNIMEWFAKRFSDYIPFERGISLGCGTGAAERQAIEAGLCNFMDAFDISPASVKAAKQEASKAGLDSKLQYHTTDLNSIELEKGHYDFALCIGSLHHVENLEHLFKELRGSLRAGGFLFINEYVGPSRLQWTEKQLRIVNKVWEIFPPEYRKPGPLISVDAEELSRADPSEAVRSSEIISLLNQYFEVIEQVEYGGSFLMPFWHQGLIPDGFLYNSARDKQVTIKLLCLIDEIMREEAILPNCYVQIVLRNNPPGHANASRSVQKHNDRRRWTDLWLEPNEMESAGLLKKAFLILRKEGFAPLMKATIRYIRKRV